MSRQFWNGSNRVNNEKGSSDCVIAAVDIGGTKIGVGMIDDDGRVLARRETPTSAKRGFAKALDRTVALLREVAQVAGAEIADVPFEKTEIALASLRDDANLIGAARVWHHRFAGRMQHAF